MGRGWTRKLSQQIRPCNALCPEPSIRIPSGMLDARVSYYVSHECNMGLRFAVSTEITGCFKKRSSLQWVTSVERHRRKMTSLEKTNDKKKKKWLFYFYCTRRLLYDLRRIIWTAKHLPQQKKIKAGDRWHWCVLHKKHIMNTHTQLPWYSSNESDIDPWACILGDLGVKTLLNKCFIARIVVLKKN